MTPFVALVFLIALVLAIARALKRVGLFSIDPGAVKTLPYRKKDYLLSKAEKSFYEVLRATVATEWSIFAKVRLLDLLWLPRGTSTSSCPARSSIAYRTAPTRPTSC